MKNKLRIIPVTAVLLISFALGGCSLFRRPECLDLPENAKSIAMTEGDSDGMMHIKVLERSYMPYGTLGNRRGYSYEDMIRDCHGYIDDDKNYRVYSLYQDPYDNYLMIMNVTGFMDTPQIWRAEDTRKQDIFTPEYVDSLDYEEWTGSGAYTEERSVRINLSLMSEDVKKLDMHYRLNGNPGGGSECSNANGSLLAKEDLLFEISEVALKDKIPFDSSFDADMIIVVTDSEGQSQQAEGVISKNVKLGDQINVKLTGSASSGYKLEEI